MVDKHIIDKTTGETVKVEDARPNPARDPEPSPVILNPDPGENPYLPEDLVLAAGELRGDVLGPHQYAERYLGGLQGRPDPKHVQGYRRERGIHTEIHSVRKTVVDNDAVRARSRDDGDGVRLAIYDPVSNDVTELRLDEETFCTLLKTCIEMGIAHYNLDIFIGTVINGTHIVLAEDPSRE